MRGIHLVVLASLFTAGPAAAAVCAPASDTSAWAFSAEPGWFAHSCASANGRTNDLGTFPTQCEGDAASVRIEVMRGAAECLVAKALDCKIPMSDFVSLDFDFHVDGCRGIWGAPLWMTPDTWQWGEGSGEIDALEFCPRDAIHMNFAGGGNQIELDPTAFSISLSEGHVTVRKDATGIVTIAACTLAAAAGSATGQCTAPVYESCAECLASVSYACWCNDAAGNIYGSGGCTAGTNCMWTLVSDVWNGWDGDEGYDHCMSAVPDLGLAAMRPNLASDCAFSVEGILVRGGGPDGSLQWGAGSPASCAALTTSGAPSFDPTHGPTHYPSPQPSPPQPTVSREPSPGPTLTLPTPEPAPLPTLSPHFRPSPAPVSLPTSNPSFQPTHFPTTRPSRLPSPPPTSRPTSRPTEMVTPVSESALSCGDLGWFNAEAYGSSSVCGESDLRLGGCSGKVSFRQAVAFCESAGARLCSVGELQADEARQTGCSFDQNEM